MPRDFLKLDPEFKKAEKRIDREKLIVPAFERAKAFLAGHSIKETDFEDTYDAGSLKSDLEYVQKMDKTIASESDPQNRENSMLSTIFNAIAVDQFGKNWMSPNAYTIGASKHDLYQNGIGNITEFRKNTGTSYMATAVRMTFSPNTRKKILEIKERIQNNNFYEVKYFKTDPPFEFKGKLENVPIVLAGCDKDMLLEVAELWMLGKTKDLEKHPLQFLILDQIYKQIPYYIRESLSNKRNDLALKYKAVLNNIHEVMKQKSDLRHSLETQTISPSVSQLENKDRVSVSLQLDLEEVFSE